MRYKELNNGIRYTEYEQLGGSMVRVDVIGGTIDVIDEYKDCTIHERWKNGDRITYYITPSKEYSSNKEFLDELKYYIEKTIDKPNKYIDPLIHVIEEQAREHVKIIEDKNTSEARIKMELEYMKKIIENARREYNAEGVTRKIIVSHDPFTEYVPSQISEEDMKTYKEWAKLLRDYIKPDVMICGHVHQAYVTYVGDELDRLGQACPVVVSSAPGSKIYSPLRGTWVENVYVGVGFETGEKITVNFVGSDGAVHKDFEI